MEEVRITPQDFKKTQSAKRKRGIPTTSDSGPSSFTTPNRFSVLSDSDSEEDVPATPTQKDVHKQHIPPVVIYSQLTNHTATLNKWIKKLTAPITVKSKQDRLLLYTKSSADYTILLHEIKTANIAYHTYPLPEAKQLRLVLKGLPTNIPEDVREELATHNITTTHIFQLKKVDKTTLTAIITYPIFILTFPASTELQQILRINRLCHCVITWEKYKNSRPVQQCYNCQAFGHSSAYCGKQPNCVKCDKPHPTKTCTKLPNTPPTCVNCHGTHPANFTGCPYYIQNLQNRQRNITCPHPSKQTWNNIHTSFQYQQSTFPTLKPSHTESNHNEHGPKHSPPPNPTTPPTITTQQSMGTIMDSLKSILSMFDIQKFGTLLRTLAFQLQNITDPMTKLVTIIDTLVTYFAPSP